jgi:Putative homoserine kinase type II (protein kinase fold)
MTEQLKTLYNAVIVEKITKGYSLNEIYEVTVDGIAYILRSSKYSIKKKEHIEFELNWMNYLSAEISEIVKPIPSLNDNLFEVVDNEYILCLFEKAESNPYEFNESLFFDMGTIIGNMHRLTKEYSGNIVQPKFEWYNGWTTWPEYNIVVDEEIQLHINRLKRELQSLPKSNDNYGIIHEDIHTGNFFVKNGKIKLFDFDDCQFNWYICDIATSLYQITQHKLPYYLTNTNERNDFAEFFLKPFFKGYFEANNLDKYWLLKINLFINYRIATAHQFVQNITIENPNVDFLNWAKDILNSNIPFISIDYKKLN